MYATLAALDIYLFQTAYFSLFTELGDVYECSSTVWLLSITVWSSVLVQKEAVTDIKELPLGG